MENKIPFIITIDTEGDNLWARPKTITTKNTGFLPRFQFLCEKFSLKPVYLTNYEMAKDPAYVEMAKDWIHRNKAEVGMHLHAWNSPPLISVTEDDNKFHPYLIEYPDQVLDEKVKVLTDYLENSFERKMISHRAGRWAMDERYFAALAKYGYKVDCSVTPGVNWEQEKGHPTGNGGSSYINYSDRPYKTPQGILEVPMTIRNLNRGPIWKSTQRVPKLAGLVRRIWPQKAWLRPNGFNLNTLLSILEWAVESQPTHVEFMIHSSEFMPGGSPYFRSKRSIDRLFRHLEIVFTKALSHFEGMTLEEFYNKIGKSF